MAPKIKPPIFGTVDRGKVGAEVPYSDLIPETYFRNSLDLNRFENKVSKELMQSYNRIILDSVRKLEAIERLPKASQPKYTAARLRSLLAQTKKSLEGWSNSSSKELIKNLDGVAKLQSEFVEEQLKKVLPAGMRSSVRSVEVSPKFAEAVVKNKATDINANVLSDDLQAAVKGVDGLRKAQGSFNLTAKMGSKLTLPNGDIISKAFRGLAEKNADLFGRTIRDGLLSGETTQQVGRRLLGQLYFGEKARTAKQLALAGGEATRMANHQISTLVRTSIQQVSDTAAQSVYKQNSDITESYKWIATLDSRTAPQCMMLDGQVFKYGQGPTPPQHFNCRCRTVATIDYEGLGIPPPNFKRSTRAAVGGPVPTGTSYGSWLQKQPPKMRAKILGGKEVTLASGKKAWRGKFQYFDKLSKKVGPDKAIAKFVSSDGSEKSLKQLQKTYGKPSNIKPKAPIKKTKLLSDKEKKSLAEFEKIKPPSKALIAKEGKYMTEAEKKGLVPYKPLTAAQKKMVDKSVVETQAKKVVSGDLKPEVATSQKLDSVTKNNLKNFKEADLSKPNHQKWFTNQKAFNSALIPKGKYNTITPKELGKLVEKKELTKLQTKYDKAFKKSLLPAKPVKPRAPLKKWDDPSFIQKNIGSTDKMTPPPPRKALRGGKKKTEDLYYKANNKNAVKDYDMSVAQLKDAEEQISNWTGSDFYNIRAVQVKQAQSVGKQLNPNEIGLLNKRIRDNSFMTPAKVDLIARNADKMERYIANTPKWDGPPRFINEIDKLHKNPFYTKRVNGTVYRGMAVHKKNIVDEVLKNMEKGEAVSTMESWSTSSKTALKFAKGEIGDGNHGIIFRHVNKHGAPIEHLNGMNESEILQPSGVRYKVISKNTKNWKEPLVEGGPKTEDFSMTEVVLEAI